MDARSKTERLDVFKDRCRTHGVPVTYQRRLIFEAMLDIQEARISSRDRLARFRFVRPSLSADPAVRAAFFDSLRDPVLLERLLLTLACRSAQYRNIFVASKTSWVCFYLTIHVVLWS